MTNSQLFTLAHQIAREIRNGFASYHEAFRVALRQAWQIALMGGNPMEKTADDFAEILENNGGRRWTKGDNDRIYFKGFAAAQLIGYEFTYYKTGNLSTVKKDGEFCSNCHGRRVLGALSDVYVDLNDGNKIVWKWGGETEVKAEFEQKIATLLGA